MGDAGALNQDIGNRSAGFHRTNCCVSERKGWSWILLLFSETGRGTVRGAPQGGAHVFTIQSVEEGA